MSFEKIHINIEVYKELAKVWDSYVNPKHIIHWNFASDDWHCPSAENDLRVGGTYKARMEAKDGSFGFDFEFVYSELVPEKLIKYTLGDGRDVEIILNDKGTSVELVINFDAETMNPVEMQRNGWQAILNNFKSYTESL